MKLFLGEYEHALDDRGRITLPRKIRQEIGGSDVVLSRGFDACIFGFDLGRWEQEAAKHLDTPVTDKTGRQVRRYLFAGAQKVQLDKLGRILLPFQLTAYAQIQKAVVVIGAGDHFEIWDGNAWELYTKKLATIEF